MSVQSTTMVEAAGTQHPAQAGISSFASVLGGEFIIRTANFAATVFIARAYGVSTFGTYASILAWISVAIMLADNGLQTVAIQKLSAAHRNQFELASAFYGAKAMLMLVATAILSFVAFVYHISPMVWIIGALLTGRAILQSFCQLHTAFLKAIRRANLIVVVQSLNFMCLFAAVIVSYSQNYSIVVVLSGMVLAQAFELIASGTCLYRTGIRLTPTHCYDCLRLIANASPVGISFLIAAISVRADVIILSILKARAEVGQFAAAQSLVVLSAAFSWLFGSVVMSDLAIRTENLAQINLYIHKWTHRIVLWLVPATALFAVLTFPAMAFLYGSSYREAAHLAPLFVAVTPLLFLNSIEIHRAIAIGAKNVYIHRFAFVVSLGIFVDALVAKAFGIVALAIAVVIREAALYGVLRYSALAWKAETA